MITPNIENIIKSLVVKADVMEMGEKIAWGSDTALMRQAAAALQSQAERIKELIDSVNFKHSKITELENERDTLRAHLAEIEKAEPVIWAISYDGVTPYTLWHEGDGPLLDGEVKRQGGTTQKLALFTRPMPVQSAEHCLWARNGHEPCQHVKPMQDVTELVEALEKLARLGNGEHYGNSDGNMIARDALSKYKGAK